MTTSARPVGFNTWFRANPGHAVRALPISFAAFSVVMLASFLFPGTTISDSFVNASLLGCGAGLVHVGFRYARTVYGALRLRGGSEQPTGLTLLDIVAAMAIVPMILIPAAVVLNVITSR